MHDESAGGEVQAAGSAGGSHAEGAEVSPTTEGTSHIPPKKLFQIHTFFCIFICSWSDSVRLQILCSSLSIFGLMLDRTLKESLSDFDGVEIPISLFTFHILSMKHIPPCRFQRWL